ncbi:hypothetical protein [uncultured Psychroserpens sp.]|uniref:hypothetical protein n=1 Tax=uncultured Psychroserpens sp. TaxID=255436 RepID=UPI002621CA7D|nr:hypothetical protein [uncultured Psychroserpens sp.]
MFPSTQNLLLRVFNLFSDRVHDDELYKAKLNEPQDETMKITKQLQASLKQLEFISYFEMHIDKRKEDSYSLSFLQELERIKYDSQMNTLELINYQKK